MGNKGIGAFIAGGLIGAGIALLYAPRTGAETRAMVADRANVAWGNAQDFGVRAQQRGQEIYEDAAARGQEFYQGAAARVQEAAEAVRPVVTEKNDELREKIEAARQRIASQVARNAEEATAAAPAEPAPFEASTVVTEPAEVASQAAEGYVTAEGAAEKPAE